MFLILEDALKKGMPTFTTFIQHLGSHSQSIRQEKERKEGRKENRKRKEGAEGGGKKEGRKIGNKEVKLSLITDDIILYAKFLDYTHTQKPVRTNEQISKVIRYKIDTQEISHSSIH